MKREMIHFEFEGKKYVVSGEAYDTNLISLPDGTLLAVDGWFESMPPQPGNLRRVEKPEGIPAIEVK